MRLVLTFLFSLFSYSILLSQEDSITNSDFSSTSIVLGFTGTQISGDGLRGIRKLGPYVGVSKTYQLSPTNQLETGLLYVQKGTRKIPYPETGDYTKYTINLHYLELPILYRPRTGNKIQKEFGIKIGYLLQQAEKDITGNLPINNKVRPFDFSAVFGFELPVFQNHIGGFRLSTSFIPIRPKRQQAKGIGLFPYELNTMASFYIRLRRTKKS